MARAVTRRAERSIVALEEDDEAVDNVRIYLNRLGNALTIDLAISYLFLPGMLASKTTKWK